VVHSSQSSTSIFMFGAFVPFISVLDSSTYTNSHLVSSSFNIGGRLVSQAFAPPQLGAFATALFPSLYALEMSSPVVFIKSTRDFLLYNFSHSLCSELHLGTLLLLASVVLLQYLVGSYRYSCTISVFPRAISILQILLIPCLYLTATYPVTTHVQVKIGCQSLSPCCISLPLSGSSSILPLRNHSHRI